MRNQFRYKKKIYNINKTKMLNTILKVKNFINKNYFSINFTKIIDLLITRMIFNKKILL